MKKKTYSALLIISITSLIICYALSFSLVFLLETPIPTVVFILLSMFPCALLIYLICGEKDNYTWTIKNLKQEYVDNPALIPIDLQQGELAKYAQFNISKRATLATTSPIKPHLFIDDINKKFVYERATNLSKVYSFKDIISYEVYENGNSKIQGRAGSALIGGALFGLGGLVVGSSMSRGISEKCNDLKLIIHIKDSHNPQITISYFKAAQCDKSSWIYRKKIENLHEVCSTLEYIVNARTLEEAISTSSQIVDQKSSKEQLQEFKEMLDDGLITQEDYEQKKKQILGL